MISRAEERTRSTCNCLHRRMPRASTFKGLSACFRGRFALADTSVDCGHQCTDLRSIAGNQRYRLLAEWKYRGPVYPHQAYSRAKRVRAACTRVTHVQHTIGPTKYLNALHEFFSGRVSSIRIKMEEIRVENCYGDCWYIYIYIAFASILILKCTYKKNYFLHKYISQK